MAETRIGQGYDVHALVAGRKLIVGGVEIPHDRGLDGHSDADVLLHAIADAILGVCGLADIGQHFPPSDDKYKDADSAELLREVLILAREAGMTRLVNIDCVIMAENPKMNPHVPSIRAIIGGILQLDPRRVGIKATTTERLGFVGREEGIAASVVCLAEFDG